MTEVVYHVAVCMMVPMTTTHTQTTVLTEIERQRNIGRDKIAEIEAEIAQWLERKDPRNGFSWLSGDEKYLARLQKNLDYWMGRRDGLNEALAQLMKLPIQ